MTNDPENHRNQHSSDYASEIGCWFGQTCLIASGDEDFLIHGNSTPWDHAPVDLLCREAGGYAAMLCDESRFHVAMKAPFMAVSSQAGWNRLRDAVWRD